MKITGISKEQVQKEAEKQFQPLFVQIESGSLFLKDCPDGSYQCEAMPDTLYVSTSLGYHEVMIQGNKTRVKVEIWLVFLKQTPYATIYEGKKHCYVAVEEGGEIQFQPYEEFLEWIIQKIQPAA